MRPFLSELADLTRKDACPKAWPSQEKIWLNGQEMAEGPRGISINILRLERVL